MRRRFAIPLILLAIVISGASPPRPPARPLTPADSLRSWVEPLFTRAKYDTILTILPAWIRRAEATHDSVLLGRALTQRGRIMIGFGRFDEAGRDIGLGIRIAEAVRDTVGLMPALHFMAYVHTGALRYDEAMRCFERRLLLAQLTHSAPDEAWARSGIGYMLLQTEHYEEAKREYLRSIELFRSSGLTRLEITSLIGLGRVQSALGNTPGAIECYQRAWVASREVGDRQNEMWAMNNLGFHELERGDWHRAAQYQRRALDIAREMKSPQAMIIPALNLAGHAQRLGDFESAEATLTEVGALCDSVHATDLRPHVDLYFAQLRQSQGRNHAARVLLRRLESNIDTVDPQNRDLVMITLAQVLAATDSVQAATGVLAKFLNGRAQYAEANARAGLEVARIRAGVADYGGALEYAVRARALAERAGQRRIAVAAAFLESSCRRALGQAPAAAAIFYAALDSMEAFRGGISTADWREVYGQEMARSVVDAGMVLREEPASSKQSERDAAFFDAMQRVKTRTLLDRITAPRAGAEAISPRQSFCTLPELQAALAPGELLLDLYVGTRHALMAAVTRDSSRVLELPGPGSQLSEIIQTFNSAIGSSDEAARAQYPPERLAVPERALGREILAGVTDLVAQSSRIFVSPDGFLAAVPFSMLITEDGGDMLITGHDVVQMPSASVLVRGRALDPDRRVTEPAVVAISDRESRMSGARDEVRDLARRYAGVRVVDEIADVDAFQAATRHCDVLHISAHALIVDGSPWLSGVRLVAASPDPDTTAARPGVAAHNTTSILTSTDSLLIERTFRPDPYLRAWQIAPLQLPAKLAVLSACETAGGRATTGEGTLGLTAAFLSSGVPVVVASLWPVSDRATAAVMKSFYRRLAKGDAVATALRTAQLEFSRTPGHSHPFYWAGFTVVGDGSMVVGMRENPARKYALLALLTAALVVVGVLVTRTRRRRPQVG